MRTPNTHPLARTYALRDPDLAALAAEALAGTTEPAEREGLVELLLHRGTSATAAGVALASLAHDTTAVVSDAVVRALNSPHPSVRITAAGEVVRRGLIADAKGALVGLLTTDPFWQVRRAAVNALAEGGFRASLVPASNDPHWRVRYALGKRLEGWGQEASARPDVLALLLEPEPHAVRLREYLHYRWTGQVPAERPANDPQAWCPFWDWDPAVLARNLELMGRAGRKAALDAVAGLVAHPDERVRSWVILALRDDGSPAQWADALARLGDPREDTAPVFDALTRGVELERLEAVAKHILGMDSPPLAALVWASGQAGDAFPEEEVQADLDRLRPRLPAPSDTTQSPLPPGHPFARAASLTPERARELVENPTLETSWHVLATAAKRCKVPVWKLAPDIPWEPPASARGPGETLALPEIGLVRPVQLGGPDGPVVSPLGVSGHYGLPVEGYVRAAEQGVNLFFWEPNYATLTRFMTRLSPADRQRVHVLVGTFEADPAKIRKDVERALRNMKIERISVFLIFWTQSWQRITPDVRDALARLKCDGLVQVYGLSTHNRGLARDAVVEGWNPVMVRHSAAHRKAEAEVFPFARERGTSILTFNNTCYGRLLDPSFRPSDCYRFTLNTPGVSACFTAPATREFLDENLD
ncbi:MAG: HEAT repeat domain-containing protein, partial [Gemmataceae bacterium]|nr:HEAT repeat domain-containing protein [Gemmataceae bacterium]